MLDLSSSVAVTANGNPTLRAALNSPDAVWLNFNDNTDGEFVFGYGIVLRSGSGKTLRELGLDPAVVGNVVRLRLVSAEGETVTVNSPDAAAAVNLAVNSFVTLKTWGGVFTQTLTFPTDVPNDIRAVRLDLLLPGADNQTAPIYCTEHDCPTNPEDGGPTL